MSSRRPSVFDRLGGGNAVTSVVVGGGYPERPLPIPSDVCRNYLQGRCQFGSKCRYVHPGKAVLEELLLREPRGDPRDLRESSSLGLSSRGSERRERHSLSSHGYQQQQPPLHPALPPPLLPLQHHSEHHHRHHSHGHHHSHSRKHRRHSGHELSPPPEPERKHRRHKKRRHRSPQADELELKGLKSKKRLRSPEEGMVSDDVSELEEGQTIDGDDLERRRMQLQRQLELLQGREKHSVGGAGVAGERRRNSSTSSSSSSGSSSNGHESAGQSGRKPHDRKRERRRRRRRRSAHGLPSVASFDTPPQDLLLPPPPHRLHRRPVSPGVVEGIHSARGGRSPSPPYSHTPHGVSMVGFRPARGPHHQEQEFRSRSRPGPPMPYPAGPPLPGFRSPSPPPIMAVHAVPSRAPLGRHAVGPPGGGHFGRRPHILHPGPYGAAGQQPLPPPQQQQQQQQQQHGHLGGGDGIASRLGPFRPVGAGLHRDIGPPEKRASSFVLVKDGVAAGQRDEIKQAVEPVPATRRKRASTEGTAERECDESSNDDSISSVLVEEAHMGEDDIEDQPAEPATTATPSKEAEASGAAAVESTADNGQSIEKLDDAKDSKPEVTVVRRPADETRPVSPCDQSRDGEIDSEEDKEQFSDWSSEDDGLLVKEIDREDKKSLATESKAAESAVVTSDMSDIRNEDIRKNAGDEDASKEKVSSNNDNEDINDDSDSHDICDDDDESLPEAPDDLQLPISSGLGNGSSGQAETTDQHKIDEHGGPLTGPMAAEHNARASNTVTGRQGHGEAIVTAEGSLLEEAEAISDDDLEALIEEDNEPMESSEESGGGEQRRKQFRPAPIYDALEIDWESLVKKTPSHVIGHGDQGDNATLERADGAKKSSTGARAQWRAHAVLLRIGLSYDLCGRTLTEQVEKALPPGATMQSTVAGLHVAMSREAAQLRDAFERAGGPYARAFSARRDLMLRKRIAAVKESVPEERSAVFEHAVQIFHQTVAAKQ